MTAFGDGADELVRLLEQRWTILRREPPGDGRLSRLRELDPVISEQARAVVKDAPSPVEISRRQRRLLRRAVDVLLEMEDDLAVLEGCLNTMLGRLRFYHYHVFYENMLMAVRHQRSLGRKLYRSVPIPDRVSWLDDEKAQLVHALRRLELLRKWRQEEDERSGWRLWSRRL